MWLVILSGRIFKFCFQLQVWLPPLDMVADKAGLRWVTCIIAQFMYVMIHISHINRDGI